MNVKRDADLVLVLKGKSIYCHQAIVKVRCPNMLTTAIKKKVTKRNGLVQIELNDKLGITYEALLVYMMYLYSGVIKLFELECSDIIHVMMIVKIYGDSVVMDILTKYMSWVMDVHQWFYVLKEAHRLGIWCKCAYFRFAGGY